jgi:hypothetical protein
MFEPLMPLTVNVVLLLVMLILPLVMLHVPLPFVVRASPVPPNVESPVTVAAAGFLLLTAFAVHLAGDLGDLVARRERSPHPALCP